MTETKTTPDVPCPNGPIGPSTIPNMPRPAGEVESSTCGLKGGSKNGISRKARIKGLTETADGTQKHDMPEDRKVEKNIHDLSAEMFDLRVKHAALETQYEVLAAELKALRIFFELTIQPGSICVKSAADDLETLGEAFTNHTHDGHGRPPVLPAAMFRKGSIRAGSGCGS